LSCNETERSRVQEHARANLLVIREIALFNDVSVSNDRLQGLLGSLLRILDIRYETTQRSDYTSNQGARRTRAKKARRPAEGARNGFLRREIKGGRIKPEI
jgi:hypothetical protein